MITFPAEPAVQLRLDLRGASCGPARRPYGYWEQVDLADLGGELRARRAGVRVLLGAEPIADSTWTGYFDLVLPCGGADGTTRPLPSRHDALVTGAHGLARYCERVLAAGHLLPRAEVRAAHQVRRWLGLLDLL